MSNTAGIYIKVGDDSVGDYRTMYLGEDGHSIEFSWDDVKVFLQGCVDGLTTYHEERQREQLPLLADEEMTDQDYADWQFDNSRKKAMESEAWDASAQIYITYPNLDLDLPQE